MSSGGVDWEQRLQNAEAALAEDKKTCAARETKYEDALKELKEHVGANPGDTDSATYKMLEGALEAAKTAFETAEAADSGRRQGKRGSDSRRPGTGSAGMLPVHVKSILREAPTVTSISQFMQKRGHESTGATPEATRARTSSPRTPVPTGVPQLDPSAETPANQTSQASSPKARDVYNVLGVEAFTFDHHFDNEDDHEPLTAVGPPCAETLESAVSGYILRFARDLVPVRCKSSQYFRFEAEYISAKGTQCVHSSIPDLLVFRRTDELESQKLTANICRRYKPLLVEVQSGSKTPEESKVQLVTALFSFVEHTGGSADRDAVYGIVVEKSLERIHVVRFESGTYQTDGPFPARCLVDICRMLQ